MSSLRISPYLACVWLPYGQPSMDRRPLVVGGNRKRSPFFVCPKKILLMLSFGYINEREGKSNLCLTWGFKETPIGVPCFLAASLINSYNFFIFSFLFYIIPFLLIFLLPLKLCVSLAWFGSFFRFPISKFWKVKSLTNFNLLKLWIIYVHKNLSSNLDSHKKNVILLPSDKAQILNNFLTCITFTFYKNLYPNKNEPTSIRNDIFFSYTTQSVTKFLPDSVQKYLRFSGRFGTYRRSELSY